jgi:hypothetical protein
MPTGAGLGLAMAPKMAIEAMRKKLVCMMNDLVVLDWMIVDVIVVLVDDVIS